MANMSKSTIEAMWAEFADCPINDMEKILESFCGWPVFTDREYIWHWFDEQYAEFGGVHALMFPNEHARERDAFRIPCKGGYLTAVEVGDGDVYCGIAIDFVRDDGKSCQCAWVETVDERDCIDGRDMLHVLVWDGDHEDYVLEQEVNRDGGEVY